MTETELKLCQCIAELMSGAEPDWDTIGLPKELRQEIVTRAKKFRAERDGVPVVKVVPNLEE